MGLDRQPDAESSRVAASRPDVGHESLHRDVGWLRSPVGEGTDNEPYQRHAHVGGEVDHAEQVLESIGRPTHLQTAGVAPGENRIQAGFVQARRQPFPEGRVVKIQVAGLEADPVDPQFHGPVEEVPGRPAGSGILLTLPYLAEEAMVRVGVDPYPHQG